MKKELKDLLRLEYKNAIEAQIADDKEAELARLSGDMAGYFDLGKHRELPDICWALTIWDEAKYWYRHNAHIASIEKKWYQQYSGFDYPVHLLIDKEATIFIKAGNLILGREALKQAIAYWKDKSGSDLILTQLGLHAAQAGLEKHSTYALSIINARQELPGGADEIAKLARNMLHYEPAQVNLLLGRWDEFTKEVERLSEIALLIKERPGLAFPTSLQDALVATSLGLKSLLFIRLGKIDPELGRKEATQAFERAMMCFYEFCEYVDWNLYFMRLNIRLVDDLVAGRPLNPNPFSEE